MQFLQVSCTASINALLKAFVHINFYKYSFLTFPSLVFCVASGSCTTVCSWKPSHSHRLYNNISNDKPSRQLLEGSLVYKIYNSLGRRAFVVYIPHPAFHLVRVPEAVLFKWKITFILQQPKLSFINTTKRVSFNKRNFRSFKLNCKVSPLMFT